MKKMLFIFITLLIIPTIVNATELTNIKTTFKHEADMQNSYQDIYLFIEADNFGNNSYMALFSSDNTNISTTLSNAEELEYITVNEEESSAIIYGAQYFEYASRYGDVYITIYEYDGTNFQKASETILVERLEYLAYTYRIVAQFYRDKSASFKINDVFNENSKINFKIGEVTDNELLLKFQDPTSSSYEELVKYAQKDTNSLISSNIKITETSVGDNLGAYANVYDTSNIKRGKYYYGYFEIDTENGKYYALNDVALYLAEEDGYLLASNYKGSVVDSELDDNSNENLTNEEIVENPSTGVFIRIGVIVLTSILSVGLYFLIKNKNALPRL